jgi:glycosyltransferase 2 family protein
MPSAPSKRHWLHALKFALVALCLAAVFPRVDPSAIAEAYRNVRWSGLLLAAVLVGFEPIVSSIKWRALMVGARRKRPPLGLVVRIVYTANFLSLLVPTALSADALRIWMLRREQYRVGHAVGSMLADRLLGLGALFLLTLAGWPVAAPALPTAWRPIVPAICLVGLLGIATLFLPCWTRLLAWSLDRFPAAKRDAPLAMALARARQAAEHLAEAFGEYSRHPAPILLALAGNLLIQLMRVLQIFCLFHALGSPIALRMAMAFVPTVLFLSMLPVSFYGAGIKEGAFVFLFAKIGIPAEISLSVSLLTYPLILSALLPGMLFFLSSRNRLRDLRRADAALKDPEHAPSP